MKKQTSRAWKGMKHRAFPHLGREQPQGERTKSISAEAVAAAPGRTEKPRSSILPRRIAGNLAWLELPMEPAR